MSAERLLQIREDLEHLRGLLASGATSITEDGQTTNFRSAEEIERQIRRLSEEERKLQGRRSRRPIINSLDLSGRF